VSTPRGESLAGAPPRRDWYAQLVSGLLFPLHERLKGHRTVAVRRRMERSQWLAPEALERLRRDRLRRLLGHAEAHVPYYRRLFAARGFPAAAKAEVEDLAALPLLTKEVIREHAEELRSERPVSKLSTFNTGGSTGEPLVFLIGAERVTHDVAAKWRATRWWGVDVGDPEIVIWGSPLELGRQDRLRALRDRVLRTELLPAFEMSEANLDRFVAAIRRARPRMLFGYPSALALVARHARRRGVALDGLGTAVAFVTGERLYDHQRREIETVLGCRVANGYGGRDAGFIAHECPSGSLHLTAEDVILEIVGPDGDPRPAGEPGEMVVTHLATPDFPFVRYRTGDVGTLSPRPCPCGRGLPVVEDVEGRATDFVVAADGTVMHGLALIYVLRELPGIEAFQIVQESRDLTRVKVVRSPRWSEDHERRIVEGFRRRLGEQVRVVVEPVERLQAEASGKYRYVRSDVASGLLPDARRAAPQDGRTP